ncbi:MAG: A/G-specific adenine glycosylase [Verrucomicrobia bacterium]|jgi:A/G-specific adenine glycosylase|nr:A/G-specific adenine glycosylase [Verrucomicrobiota bacterium]
MTKWSKALLAWFEVHRRPMPWRDDPTPYRVWVSEIMLQQTQVATVIPYFERFTEAFPSVGALAAANVQDVLKRWEGLGYYSRARNLLKAARFVVNDLGGHMPTSPKTWMALPGVGEYTAAAISSIVYGQAVPSVDGNVLRVFSRFWGLEDDVSLPATRDMMRRRLLPHIRTADPSAFNQAMMELGALVCRPRSPECVACPLAPRCVARRQGLTEQLPVKAQKAKVPHHTEAVAVITHKGKTLLCRRHEAGLLGGLWEFPGKRRDGREGLQRAVMHGVLEQTGLTVKVLLKLGCVTHTFSHFKVTIHAYACSVSGGAAEPLAHEEVRWVTPPELQSLPLSTAQRKIADL